jgi:hypothetical protein
MVTDCGESNCEMDKENNNEYKYAEEMLQVKKTDVNLLDWIYVDLESTGQAEIDDHWRKPRAIEMKGKINEQQTVKKEGDDAVTKKSKCFETVRTQEESRMEDDKKKVWKD